MTNFTKEFKTELFFTLDGIQKLEKVIKTLNDYYYDILQFEDDNEKEMELEAERIKTYYAKLDKMKAVKNKMLEEANLERKEAFELKKVYNAYVERGYIL